MVRVAKNKDDKMDALIYAINRMAEAQEKGNELIAKNNELARQSYELNSKQYTLNIDNHKHDLEADDLAAQYKAGVEEAMDAAKDYIDNHVLEVQKVLDSHKRSLINITTELHLKADQEKISDSMVKKMFDKIKMKGTI